MPKKTTQKKTADTSANEALAAQTRTEIPAKTKRSSVRDEDELSQISNIGSMLRALRQTKGLKQADLANAIGLVPSSYSHYERGVRIPDLAVLVKISNFYAINISYLVFLTCVGCAGGDFVTIDEVFSAYSHSELLPEKDVLLLSKCNRLSPDSRENLILFLSAAMDCDDNYKDS